METKNLETKINNAEVAEHVEELNIPRNEVNDSKNIDDEKKTSKKPKEKEQEQVENVKDEESKIKEAIQKRLKEKIREAGFWTDEQLSRASNIEESQTKMTTDYIYDMGKDRLGNKQEDKESNSKKYYNKLKKKCMDITENEAQVNQNFDIEAAIEKEEEIKKKLENGEITSEEALKAYSEPIPELGGMLSSLQKYGVKTYEDIYKEMLAKEDSKDKSKAFRESLSKDAPSLEEQAKNSREFQEKVASVDNSRNQKTSNDLSK